MTSSFESISRMRRKVSSPLMPPIRTSMITRSGFNLGMIFSPSSPLAAVVNSISGESKIRRNEYCTSSSSSIKSSFAMSANYFGIFVPKVESISRAGPRRAEIRQPCRLLLWLDDLKLSAAMQQRHHVKQPFVIALQTIRRRRVPQRLHELLRASGIRRRKAGVRIDAHHPLRMARVRIIHRKRLAIQRVLAAV